MLLYLEINSIFVFITNQKYLKLDEISVYYTSFVFSFAR